MRTGAMAFLAGSSSLEMFGQGGAARQFSPLKSQAQYQGEAADFDAAIRELTQLSNFRAATDADIARFNQSVEAAAAKLDHHHSWMVAQCMADTNLAAWVKRTLRDEAAVKAFIAEVKRNPKVVDNIPGVAALSRNLAALSAQKRGLVLQLAAKAREVAGKEAASASAAAKAKASAQEQECARTWSIVGAIVALVVVIVVAIVVTVFANDVNGLVATYRGTGADISQAALQKATVDYRLCVAAAQRLPPAQQKKALALCQAQMLEAKAAWIA